MDMVADVEVALPDEALPGAAGAEVFVFEENTSRGEIVYRLSERIPQNEFGLPIFFLRSDLLAGTYFSESDLDVATVGLFYYEGFPTLESGRVFWGQLPHEPQGAFEAFKAFLDQAHEHGIRQLDLLTTTLSEPLEVLANWAKEFYWSARARAYDLFIVAAEAKKRQSRIRQMENKHYNQANTLFDKLLERFAGENADWIEELNAKEAIEVLETLVKIQRISVGLTGQHASSTARGIDPGESTESVIRKLAQGGGMTGASSDRFAAQLQGILDNPEEGAVIQAAILQVTAGGNRRSFDADL